MQLGAKTCPVTERGQTQTQQDKSATRLGFDWKSLHELLTSNLRFTSIDLSTIHPVSALSIRLRGTRSRSGEVSVRLHDCRLGRSPNTWREEGQRQTRRTPALGGWAAGRSHQLWTHMGLRERILNRQLVLPPTPLTLACSGQCDLRAAACGTATQRCLQPSSAPMSKALWVGEWVLAQSWPRATVGFLWASQWQQL